MATINKVITTKYTVRVENSSVWGHFTIDSENGTLDIQSDYGNWGYRWNATGCDDLRKFLVKLGRGYLMGKLTTRAEQDVFDPEGTWEHHKKTILRERRLDRYGILCDWREVYDDVKCACDDSTTARNFLETITENYMGQCQDYKSIMDTCEIGDYQTTVCTKENPIHIKFWNELWLPLVALWKNELVGIDMVVNDANESKTNP